MESIELHPLEALASFLTHVERNQSKQLVYHTLYARKTFKVLDSNNR